MISRPQSLTIWGTPPGATIDSRATVSSVTVVVVVTGTVVVVVLVLVVLEVVLVDVVLVLVVVVVVVVVVVLVVVEVVVVEVVVVVVVVVECRHALQHEPCPGRPPIARHRSALDLTMHRVRSGQSAPVVQATGLSSPTQNPSSLHMPGRSTQHVTAPGGRR